VEENKLDYIIVGQGIAGSLLAYELIKRGKKILIFNKETENTSSLKAGGLYNPITGKTFVKTWRADDLFLNLEKYYNEIENNINTKFLHQIPIYRPFVNVEAINLWDSRIGDPIYEPYIKEIIRDQIGIPNINDTYGGIILNHSGYIDLRKLILELRAFFIQKESYLPSAFDHHQLQLVKEKVRYKKYFASKIIFCEGPLSDNPFWKDLPFKYVRGETIDVELDFNSQFIINQGVFIIPKNGFFTVGSTYDHNILSFEPHEKGIEELIQKLKKIYKGKINIIQKRAGVRPATFDRKPFIGFHEIHKNLAIFNGFGTKGVSLVPYFAQKFADKLEGKSDLDKEVNIERVY